MNENAETLMKELKSNQGQLLEAYKLMFATYQSNGKLVDDRLNTMSSTINSIHYKVEKNHETIKDDIAAVKSRVSNFIILNEFI
jgi:hypothetical protein